jgi:hypothetical protein
MPVDHAQGKLRERLYDAATMNEVATGPAEPPAYWWKTK